MAEKRRPKVAEATEAEFPSEKNAKSLINNCFIKITSKTKCHHIVIPIVSIEFSLSRMVPN